MTEELGPLKALRRTGDEKFRQRGDPMGFSLLDFWAWSVSDLVSNATRGRLAEYLVARAIGISTAGVRDEWAACDLATASGIKIEVKSAAYLQAWGQRQLSIISFSTRPTRSWDPATGVFSAEPTWQSDMFVFALLAHREKSTLDPLDVTQWQFFVLPTAVLKKRTRSQHSITLSSLQALCKRSVSFSELEAAVEQAGSSIAMLGP